MTEDLDQDGHRGERKEAFPGIRGNGRGQRGGAEQRINVVSLVFSLRVLETWRK